MKATEADRVGHMVEAARNILRATEKGKRAFLRDAVLQAAVARWFEVFGEAAKHVSEAAQRMAPDIPWKTIKGFRDVLIHAYETVDLERLWDATRLLPGVVARLERLSKRLD